MTDPLEPVTYRPIGVIHTPFTDVDGMPIQPAAAAGVRGTIGLDPGFAAGLLDLDGFSHLILLYHLHQVRAPRLTVTPFLDIKPYIPAFDDRAGARVGWFTGRLDRLPEVRADGRFGPVTG